MKAIEVITLLANKNTEFFNALHSYCEQEDVLGLSVVMKQDYSRSILLLDGNGCSMLDSKKVTKQFVQIIKVTDEEFDKLIRAYYHDKDWMDNDDDDDDDDVDDDNDVDSDDDADIFDETGNVSTINTSETRQGSCKVEINQETGVISIYTNVI